MKHLRQYCAGIHADFMPPYLAAVMPQPHPAICPDKQSLIEDVCLAMKRLLALHGREMGAAGDFVKIKAIKEEIATVREWRDRVLEDYKRHLAAHGC